MSKAITVKALDPQHVLKYFWHARPLAQTEDWIVLYGEWGRLLHHAEGETVPITNRSLEFYARRRPYVISVILDRAGKLQEYYGRVILPPLVYEPAKQIEFVMLGVDLPVTPDYDYEILDRAAQNYDDETLSTQAQHGLMELVELLERREGPFDPEFVDLYLQRAREHR
jgi:protein associated with RNAse G/E